MKHTPGPWKIDRRLIHGMHAAIIAESTSTPGIECIVAHIDVPQREGEAEANAEMIAAAPGVRDALEYAILYFEEYRFGELNEYEASILVRLKKALQCDYPAEGIVAPVRTDAK